MHHFVYTVDIATSQALSLQQKQDIMSAIDALLADYPIEFEDWKESYHTEERKV